MAKRSQNKPKKSNVVAQARGAGGAPAAPKRPLGRVLWENFKSLAGAVMIYLIIKTFLMEAFRIPSGSMIPTLRVGDWLFVNKVAFGPHIPFTNSHIPGYHKPTRDDIVVFVSPYQADELKEGRDPTPTLVKRLIGLPGDTIHMKNGVVHINGLPHKQGFGADANWKGDPNGTDEYGFKWQHQYEVKGTRYGTPPAQPTHDNWGPLVIPAGHYFMMGDNRYCSKDSRYWGLVPRENFRGRPMFVYYSYRAQSGEGPECNPDQSDRALPFITDIRWGRIGDWIR